MIWFFRKNIYITFGVLNRFSFSPHFTHYLPHYHPQRFSSSREVGPYLGLVPKQEDSGDSQPQLGIGKTGDRMLRRLLVGSSQYMLGAFGPDTDLRRYGLRLCERGGKNAKKRAVVAVARKLAVLLHHLWVTGDVYEPLHHTGVETRTAQATAA